MATHEPAAAQRLQRSLPTDALSILIRDRTFISARPHALLFVSHITVFFSLSPHTHTRTRFGP